MPAWNYWYHMTNNTFGTWLRGDPRGWRDRQHRTHVDGDYRNPPPQGQFEGLHAYSKAHLTRPPVILDWTQRTVVCEAVAAALTHHDITFVEIAVAAKHMHLLAQFPPDRHMSSGRPILDPVRHFTGIAKKESARRLSKRGLSPEGGIWAEKAHPIPIKNEAHWARVKQYIRNHHQEGAAVWSIIAQEWA